MREYFTSSRARYEVLEKYAEGGMGITFRVRSEKDQKEYLLKKLRVQHAKDWKAIELFEREAGILEKLDHVQIPRYVDFFYDQEQQYFALVQTFIEGKPLSHFIEKQIPLPRESFIRYLEKSLEVLDYLHTLVPPVIHRDITPNNLIVSNDQIYLVDFGSVKCTLSKTSFTSVGTFGYMPPEQAMGQAETGSDLYALGMTFIALASHSDPSKLPIDKATGQIDVEKAVQLPSWLCSLLKDMTHPGIGARLRNAETALKRLKQRDTSEHQAVKANTPFSELTPIEKPPIQTIQPYQAKPFTAHNKSKSNWWKYVLGVFGLFAFIGWLQDDDYDEYVYEEDSYPVKIATPPVINNTLEELLDECKSGNMGSCNDAGYRYGTGKNVPVDYDKAHHYYEKACDGGNMLGCSNLGYLYANAKGVTKDEARAVFYYQKACDKNNALGCNNLGHMYQNGSGVPTDVKQAFNLYQKACDNGNMLGCNNLGVLYKKGQGVTKDLEMSASLYRKACNGKNMLGCNNLGWAYEKGIGVSVDYFVAFENYQKSCEGGRALGCNNLGILYEDGRGVLQNYQKASDAYQKACDGDIASGCTNLGYLYANAKGVPKDDIQAVSLYEKACSGGNMLGCNNLGVMYEKNRGVAYPENTRTNMAKAVSLYEKACNGGNMLSCNNLGLVYEQGLGVEKNEKKAVSFYQKACDGGRASGCKNLGLSYEKGKGVSKNKNRARKFYQKACDAGDSTSCKKL